MQDIIAPVDKELLKAELTPDKKLRDSNRGGNEIYVVTWQDSPNVVTEVGRLREEAFRLGGGGTGLSCDLDEYDKMEVPYKQLIVWDPDADAIIGGYRYILGPEVTFEENGQPHLATNHQFRFSERFIKEYLPQTMELGRSFVAPAYQSSKAGAKAIFTLDNLWDGIAAVMVDNPSLHYFFGKVTVYNDLDLMTQDCIYRFIAKHFPDPDGLVTAIAPYICLTAEDVMDGVLTGSSVDEDLRALKELARSRGTNIPPLVNAYVQTSSDIRSFGAAPGADMDTVKEVGILVSFDNIYDDKKRRHVDSYINNKNNN